LDYSSRAQPGLLPRTGGNGCKKRLTARARWEATLGWDYIEAIQAAKNQVAPADLPPRLEWEAPVWDLYAQISTQWRYGFGGRTGLDYGPAIHLMQARGWDVGLGLDLLRRIELETLKQDARERDE
jgi:hypothetical protein